MQPFSKLMYLYQPAKFFCIKFFISFVKKFLKQFFIPYKNSNIHFSVFGNGEKKLFCFHGYGENSESFSILESLLAKDFTMYCIDFPFHGKTEWNEKNAFTPFDLIAIIQRSVNFSNQKISLLGYSLGGRVSLQLIELIPKEISQAVLLAPDGLHKNFWYRFSTQTKIGNAVFKYSVHHPSSIFYLMKISDTLRLMNKSILKIAHYYLDAKEERMLLYKRWTIMRKFNPCLSLVKKNIFQNNIFVCFLFGRHDNIILSRRSNFFKSNKKNIQIKVIDAGHQLLKEKYAGEIAKLFNQ